ncbi:unnamed protein product [Peronospora effusa]|nr:unnamed protein product [Peronospora effusa]
MAQEILQQKLDKDERMMGAIESEMLRSTVAVVLHYISMHSDIYRCIQELDKVMQACYIMKQVNMRRSQSGGHRKQHHQYAYRILARSTRQLKIARRDVAGRAASNASSG